MSEVFPHQHILWHGLIGSSASWAISKLKASHAGPMLVVCPEEKQVTSVAEDLEFFLEKQVLVFPAKLSPTHPDYIEETQVFVQRSRVLQHLIEGAPCVILASLEAVLQLTPPREAFERASLFLQVKGDFPRSELLKALINAGYTAEERVDDPGDFSVRGSIIDIYTPQLEFPIRLEFFADEIESIRVFSPENQKSLESLEEVVIIPGNDKFRSDAQLGEIRKKLKQLCDDKGLTPAQRLEVDQALEDRRPHPALEYLFPIFYETPSHLINFLPKNATVVHLDPLSWKRSVKELREKIETADQALLKKVASPPEKHFISYESWSEALVNFTNIEISDVPLDHFKGMQKAFTVHTHISLKHELISARRSEYPLQPLVDKILSWQDKAYTFRLVAYTEASQKRLESLLSAHIQGVPVVLGHLSEGFELEEEKLIYVTEGEIFGQKKANLKTKKEADLPSVALGELSPGNAIVHVDFGVGIFRGLQRLTINKIENDFILIEYAGGDKLFLPVYRLNRIHKYVGADGKAPSVDKLGNLSAWESTRAKAQKAVEEMAQELIALYASRMVAKKKPYGTADTTYLSFESDFPFEETRDQLRTLEDVSKDFESDKPMDRLVCGDVGFGKTEIALRAAMRTAMEGKQTALLVPTTVLCQQHYETFKRRFAKYPIKVDFLSRFKEAKQQKEVVEQLKTGKLDIVIGTHRLLSKDISFANLGLLILDEEHRFGVKHKEAIKQYRNLVNVLTLTATPIPRTLQLSMAGIRDLSVINTPPLNRKSVHTILCRSEDDTIRDAIKKELSREGQVFFLHNRVETIEATAAYLKKLVPEAKIAIGHAQMDEKKLEDVMLRFLKKEANILLCTTIIESGLDIPDANTILISRADCFGLAQLYQLRGRVGRSDRDAYCYLLIPGEDIIGRDALKRLKALKRFTELGSGLKIALHDLEIRGAGNLLGSSQSGHIANVGFELYSQLLEREVRKLKGEQIKEEVDPEIQTSLPAFIPETYVRNTDERLLLYRRLSASKTDLDLQTLQDEFKDRFGPLPPTVENLFEVLDMKMLAKRCGILNLKLGTDSPSIEFSDQAKINVDKLLKMVKKDKRIQLRPDQKLILDFSTADDVFKETKKILLELYEHPVKV